MPLAILLVLEASCLAANGALDAGELHQRAEAVIAPLAVVFDKPPARIPSDTSVDAPLLGNGYVGVAVGAGPGHLDFHLARNDFWRLKTGYQECMPKTFGRFSLRFKGMRKAQFSARQDLYNAQLRCRLAQKRGAVEVRAWVAATADVLVLELQSEGIGTEVSLELVPQRSDDSTVEEGKQLRDQKREGGWAVRRFEDGVDIPTAAACVVLQSTESPTFRLEPGTPVYAAVGLTSAFKHEDPLRAAYGVAARARDAGTREALWCEHTGWWHEFWAKSLVEVDDPDIMRHYYLSNYVLGSCCRDPLFPPPIFGTWITTDTPAWAGDYHLNYNHMAPYYGLYSSNHVEQADVYHDPILQMMETAQYYAKTHTGCRGVLYPVGIGPMGMDSTASPGRGHEWEQPEGATRYAYLHGQKSNAAYCCVNLAMRFYHTWDPDYARLVYPLVKETVSFWEDYLRFEDGRYMDYNDAVHESGGPGRDERYKDVNAILAIGLLHQVFQFALDLAEVTEDQDAPRDKWRHILEHLPEWPTQERDDKTVFRYTERGTPWFINNTLGIQHIYPAGAIGLDSETKWLDISRNTIEVMGRWKDGNGMNSFFPAAVRIGYNPETILDKLHKYVTKDAWPNGFAKENLHGIENCSIVPNTINEMLCMSNQDVLRVFPVWPRQRDARFHSLRAQGAFLVSSQLKGGQVQYVRILSERGRPCTLVNPWPGQAASLSRNGDEAQPVRGERFSLSTEAGDVLVLRLCEANKPLEK